MKHESKGVKKMKFCNLILYNRKNFIFLNQYDVTENMFAQKVFNF